VSNAQDRWLSQPWWLLPPGRVQSGWWAATAALLFGLDYRVGLAARFPTLYVIPVVLAAWYSGRGPAMALAVTFAAEHALLQLAQPAAGALLPQLTLTAVRGAVILVLGVWFARLSNHEQALRSRVRTLEGLLPICSICKNVRNETGEWEQLEQYIGKRSDATFSHGLCPTCQQIHYGKYFADDAPPASLASLPHRH
jgi:hypothetical protein